MVELEIAADSLVAAFPEEFRNDFKVFVGAIYPVLSYASGGVEESWEKLKAQAAAGSDYYLLMVRVYEGNGKIVRMRWDLHLPAGDPFDCIDETKKLLFFGEMSSKIKKDDFRYSDVLNSLKALTNNFKLFFFVGFRDGCEYCSESSEGIAATLTGLGFVGKQIREVTVNGGGGSESGYTYNKKVTIKGIDNGGDTINVYSDQVEFHTQMSSAMNDVYANFVYYNTETLEGCDELNSLLFDNLPVSANKDDLDKRSSPQNYIYKNDVVVVDGSEGNKWVWVREDILFKNIPEFPKGTIHIVLLSGTGLDIDQLVAKVSYFYDLIEINLDIKKYKFGGIPKKIGIIDLKNKDAISIVGTTGLKVATFVKDIYSEMISDNFLNSDLSKEEFVKLPNNLERGDAWGRQIISMVKTNVLTSDVLNDWKSTGDKLKLAAFLIFHATGHNAGLRHGDINTDKEAEGFGYMDSGNQIVWMLGKDRYNYSKFIPELNSLEDLIIFTRDKYPIMINKIRARFE